MLLYLIEIVDVTILLSFKVIRMEWKKLDKIEFACFNLLIDLLITLKTIKIM